jgi:ABC-2 type transport system ATP-binding protein
MIRGLAALGKTIFLTTHFMDEAQLLANRVAVIARGEIVAEGTPQTIGDRHARATQVSFSLPDGADLPDAFDARRVDGRYELETDNPTRRLRDLTEWALSANLELVGLEVRQPSLEDVYLQLTEEPAE